MKNQQDVAEIQRRLSGLTFYPASKIDGLWGNITESAVTEFCDKVNVPHKSYESELYQRFSDLNPESYITDEIIFDFESGGVDPREWSNAKRSRFRDFAALKLLPAVISLSKKLYMDIPMQWAVIMANIEHETFGTYLPVKEAFYVGEKAQLRYLKSQPYGLDEAGRGLMMLTWKSNQIKYGNIFRIPLHLNADILCDLTSPESRAIAGSLSLFTAVHGFATGTFTGKKMSDYINKTK